MFRSRRQASVQSQPQAASGRLAEFSYLSADDIYLDAACQSMRPQPVIDALNAYYHEYNACGERVKYEWGRKVDETVERARANVLSLLSLSPREYLASFTLNTTYALNLVLNSLPDSAPGSKRGPFARVVTSHIEHNSVFVPTMVLAQRLGLERLVLERAEDGALEYEPSQLERAVVVVNAASNIDGRQLVNLADLVRDTHDRGGIVVVDAAQAMAHGRALLVKTDADAICFSAHKMYGASLGCAILKRSLAERLNPIFIGGGMVSGVTEHSYDLIPDEPETRLEAGLQAWGEIAALDAAATWLATVRPAGVSPSERLQTLSTRLFDGLAEVPGLITYNSEVSPVISVYSPSVDAHRLAVFLSKAGIMVRSGYFCAHHMLIEHEQLPPLLRFSLGLHSTEHDIDQALDVLSRLMKGLA